jgi:hypothetical protein
MGLLLVLVGISAAHSYSAASLQHASTIMHALHLTSNSISRLRLL